MHPNYWVPREPRSSKAIKLPFKEAYAIRWPFAIFLKQILLTIGFHILVFMLRPKFMYLLQVFTNFGGQLMAVNSRWLSSVVVEAI